MVSVARDAFTSRMRTSKLIAGGGLSGGRRGLISGPQDLKVRRASATGRDRTGWHRVCSHKCKSARALIGRCDLRPVANRTPHKAKTRAGAGPSHSCLAEGDARRGERGEGVRAPVLEPTSGSAPASAARASARPSTGQALAVRLYGKVIGVSVIGELSCVRAPRGKVKP